MPAAYKKAQNGEIYFEISNIAAADLDKDFTLTIGENSCSYSALSDAKRVVEAYQAGTLTDAKLYDLVRTLWVCNCKANTFFD